MEGRSWGGSPVHASPVHAFARLRLLVDWRLRVGGILSDQWNPRLGVLTHLGDPQSELVPDLDHFAFGYFLPIDFECERGVTGFVELDHEK